MNGGLTIIQFAGLGAVVAMALWLISPKEGAAMKGGRARHLASLLVLPGLMIALIGVAIVAVRSVGLEYDAETWATVLSGAAIAGVYALAVRRLPVVGPLVSDRDLAARSIRGRGAEAKQ